jgi:hypothetical protein
MDERELAGLLYRADWTRLALAGTLRGAGWLPNTTFTHHSWPWGAERGPQPFSLPDPPPPPPYWTYPVAGPRGEQRSLILAPGRRYRVTGSGGSRVIGCDGQRVWQWFTDLPPDTGVRFDHRPEPPVPELLAPAWLLLGYRLTVGEETTVAGRPGIAVTGVARTGPSLGVAGTMLLPWGLVRRPGRVSAVIDAELGILLRRELSSADDDADEDVTEFLSLEVGGSSDPSVFTAPEGSFPGDGQRTDRPPLEEAGRAALKMAGGLAAGGLGAAIRCSPKRQADPFADATAEEPDDAMPDDEPLPGWTADQAADGADDADGRAPASDEVLNLLYRGGLEPAPFSGTLHEWIDGEVAGGALLGAVPEAARRAGFGGVGFLVDTILADERDAGRTTHTVYRVRVGALDRYRVDRVRRVPPARAPRLRMQKHDGVPLTVACDGERTFKVYEDEVRVGPASELDQSLQGDLRQLVDGSWLLAYRLSGGEVVEVDGRTGYRVIATAGTGPVTRAPLSWLPGWWLPAVAVVDASSGRLLRITRYRDGKIATRLELRSLSDGGSDDFGFTPPEGLPVVDGQPWSPPEDLQAAIDGFKEKMDATVSAARGFLGSFLGGGRRGR